MARVAVVGAGGIGGALAALTAERGHDVTVCVRTPFDVLTVTRDGGQLICQATGQGKLPVFPSAKDEFFYRAVEATITFKRGDDGEVSGLVLHQNGANLPGTKVK